MKKKISTKTIDKVKNCGGVIVRLKKNGLLDVNVDTDTFLSMSKSFLMTSKPEEFLSGKKSKKIFNHFSSFFQIEN